MRKRAVYALDRPRVARVDGETWCDASDARTPRTSTQRQGVKGGLEA